MFWQPLLLAGKSFAIFPFFFLFFSWPALVFFPKAHWDPWSLHKPFVLFPLWGGVFELFLGQAGTVSLLALDLAGHVLFDRLAEMHAVWSSGQGPNSKISSASETPPFQPVLNSPWGKSCHLGPFLLHHMFIVFILSGLRRWVSPVRFSCCHFAILNCFPFSLPFPQSFL